MARGHGQGHRKTKRPSPGDWKHQPPHDAQAAALIVRHGEGLGFPSTRNSSYAKKKAGTGGLGEGVSGEAACQCPGDARMEQDSPSISANERGCVPQQEPSGHWQRSVMQLLGVGFQGKDQTPLPAPTGRGNQTRGVAAGPGGKHVCTSS